MSPQRNPSSATRAAATRAVHSGWLPVVAAAVADAVFGFMAFRLSFAALTALAVQHGVDSSIAWMFAVLVDGGAVMGTVGVAMAHRTGRPVAPYWLVVIGSAGVSLAFNIAHSDRTPLGIAIAVTPPLAQLVATELLVRLLPEPDARPTREQVEKVTRATAQAVRAAEVTRMAMERTEAAAADARRAGTEDHAGRDALTRRLEELVAGAEHHARTAQAAAEEATGYRPGSAERIVHDLWTSIGWPEESDIVAALKAAGLPDSVSQAKKVRTKVGRAHPKLPTKRQQLALVGD